MGIPFLVWGNNCIPVNTQFFSQIHGQFVGPACDHIWKGRAGHFHETQMNSFASMLFLSVFLKLDSTDITTQVVISYNKEN